MGQLMKVQPERRVAASKEGPLRLQVRCQACGFTSKHQFDWISMDSTAGGKANWDTLLLPKVMVCRRCKKVDDYELTLGSQMDIVQRVMKGDPRVIHGRAELWDGTVVYRAGEAIEKLRALAAKHADNPMAWRRLGHACGKYGQSEQAIAAWKKAMELDPAEVEAAAALASHCFYEGDLQQSLLSVRDAIRRLPEWNASPEQRAEMVEQIVAIVWDVLNALQMPMAIVTWRKGEPDQCRYIELRHGTDWDLVEPGLLPTDLETTDLIPLSSIKPNAGWFTNEAAA